MSDKEDLRSRLRAWRLELWREGDGEERSLRLQERLLSSSFWKDCRRVAAYVSVKGEAGTGRIVEEALRSGRELFLPRCRRREEAGWPGAMDFIACDDVGALKASSFGIPEPDLCPGSRVLSPEELSLPDTLILVPALAFDHMGFRLGYGGGYYDRLLSSADCPCIGLTFHELLLDALPRDAWDRAVTAICTEETLLCL